jgi:hypothetical protein
MVLCRAQKGEYHSIDRTEAVAVLRELTENNHKEFAFAELVEIRRNDGVELRIKCVLDAHDRESIRDFLEKRMLKMREEKGYIIIY